jgi:hypothetical protein
MDNASMPEMFRELHDYKTIWERKQFFYDYALVSLIPNQIGWEIKITKTNVYFYFTSTNESDINIIQKCLSKSTITNEELDLTHIRTDMSNFKACELELKYHYFLSLSTDKKELEPIASILDTQNILREDDYAIIQYIFCPEAYDWNTSCSEAYEKFKNGEMPIQFRIDKKEMINLFARTLAKIGIEFGTLMQELILEDPKQVQGYEIKDSNVARILKDKPLSRATMEKAKHNAYVTTIRLLSHSKSEERKDQILRGLTVSFNTLSSDNHLIPKKVDLKEDYIEKIINRIPTQSLAKNILTSEEVSKLCLLPQITLQNTYKMDAIETREVEISKVLLNGDIPIGTAYRIGKTYDVYWERTYDIMTLPKITCGGMGAGKTKYTAQFVASAAKAGHGAIVPDFIKNCELSKEIERHIPSDRTVILDLTDISNPFSLAYSEIKITDEMTRWEKIKNASDIADQTAYLINALNDGMVQPLTSKMNKVLYSACMISYTTGHIKVYDVINILQNHIIRHEYINEAVQKGIYKITDVHIANLLYLDELSQKGKVIGTNEAKIESVMDRIDVLLRNPYLELMLMSEPNDTVNFVNYMDEGKIVLIRIPENVFKKKWVRDVLMTYFMSRIWLAIQIRATQKKPKINHVVTDEIHQVPTAAKLVADTITEGRNME